jgi:hypothetical protein
LSSNVVNKERLANEIGFVSQFRGFFATTWDVASKPAPNEVGKAAEDCRSPKRKRQKLNQLF